MIDAHVLRQRGVALAGTMPANTGCAWSIDDGTGPAREVMARCEEEVKVRVAYGRVAVASVDVLLPDGTAQRVVTDIQVRDVLIAGLNGVIVRFPVPHWTLWVPVAISGPP